MEIVPKEEVGRAVEWLEEGKIIIYPTDTAYGLGADATNPEALKRVIEFKGRAPDKPISAMVSSPEEAGKYVEPTDLGKHLYSFLPGPFTIVSKSKGILPRPVESLHGRVGIRVPASDFCLSLAREFGRPITATSANLSGKPSLYSVPDILKHIPESRLKDVLIVDGGRLPGSLSNVIDDRGFFIREGPMVAKRKFIRKCETPREGAEFLLRLMESMDAEIVFLQGSLGAGKTAIVKEIGRMMGEDDVSSPTFTIINEHRNFVHADFYRIKPEELELTGFYNYVGKKPIFVEWPEKCSKEMRELNLRHRTIWCFIHPDHAIEAWTDYV